MSLQTNPEGSSGVLSAIKNALGLFADQNKAQGMVKTQILNQWMNTNQVLLRLKSLNLRANGSVIIAYITLILRKARSIIRLLGR